MPLARRIILAGAAAGAACATIWWISVRDGLALLMAEEVNTVVVDMTVLSSLAIGKACVVSADAIGMVSSPLLRGIAEASLFAVGAGQSKTRKNATNGFTVNGANTGNATCTFCCNVAAISVSPSESLLFTGFW